MEVTETTAYTYNKLGKLAVVTYPDLKTIEKFYDELGRLIKTKDANELIETMYYDAHSNLIKLKDKKNSEFTYTYDNRQQLLTKSITGKPAETVAFAYDLSGRRTQMTDPTGTTGYQYHPATGELNQITYPDGRKLRYDYDIRGNRQQMTDPFGGNVYYSYDALNRLKGVGTAPVDLVNNKYDAKYDYLDNGLLGKISQGNGVTTTYTYDLLKLNTLQHKKADNTLLNSYDYNYDPNNNITQAVSNSVTANYTYDPLNRIETGSEHGEAYTYDTRGNRIGMQRLGQVESPNTLYTYDARDQLTDVGTTTGKTVHYAYNGDGLLYDRTENGVTIRNYYDGAVLVAEGNVTQQIVDNTSGSIQYTGNWTVQNVLEDYNGSISYSGNAGDAAQVTFTGTSVAVAVRKGPGGGKVDVVIDNITRGHGRGYVLILPPKSIDYLFES